LSEIAAEPDPRAAPQACGRDAARERAGVRQCAGWTIAIAGIVTVAAALRLAASRGDFWIDEIFSWEIARRVGSVLAIFTRVHSDNNHHLNTLWMYLAGDHRQIYRAPAILCGTISVALLAVLARRDGAAASVIGCILGAASYFLIQYSSEARGYAPAMMFALACVWLMRRYLRAPRRRISMAFGACAILGVLWHLTFIYVYAGLAAWSIVEIGWDRAQMRRERVGHLVRLHAVPATFLAVFYILDVSKLHAAGGPVYQGWAVVAETFAWTIGGPRGGMGLWAGIIAVVGIIAFEIICMARRGEREWIPYAVGILIAPAAMLLLWKQPYLYPRYFFLCAALVYLLLARFLGRLWDRGGAARAACAAAMVLYLAGNAMCLDAFFTRGGRGQYLEAMQFMIDQSRGAATVGSVQDSRNAAIVAFYRQQLDAGAGADAGAGLKYIPRDRYTAASPDWMIVEGIESAQPKSSEYTTDAGARYRLVKTFGCWGLSGFDWYIMRRAGAGASRGTGASADGG
jgi:hypothetical protein